MEPKEIKLEPKLKRGDQLLEGILIIDSKQTWQPHNQIVLAIRMDATYQPYVTWVNNRTVKWGHGLCLGHYFSTLEAALEDFKTRT